MTSVIFLVVFGALDAQKKPDIYPVDKVALQIPDSMTKTTSGIARYINARFADPADKSRAIFVWIAKNIRYDIDNMFAINFYANSGELIDVVLKTRKGICMHYSELFNDIAKKVGLRSYVVTGFTKQNGFIDYIPHSWCAVFIGSSWALLDPTWGSGYVQNSKYVSELNNFYFMTKPEQLIKSHMPFDPLWQFLNYPVTNQEFYEGKFLTDKTKPFFNYSDTLSAYEHESEIERLKSSSRRIEANGVRNSMIFDRLQHNRREIEYYNGKMLVGMFNSAIDKYNEGVIQLNRFIDYRNKQFTPKKSDPEIKQMLDVAETLLADSRKKLLEIKNPDQDMAASMLQLNRSIDDATVNLNEQKAFLNKYFSTSKVLRKSLFYKYTLMGIPVGK